MGSPAATPIAFVRAIVLGYEKYGVDPGPALRQAQITPALLRQPDGRITARQMELISGLAMQELDDEALGWFGRRLRWGSYGMLCRASLSAPTLGVALKRWCRHHRLLTDDVAHRLTIDGDTVELAIDEHADLGPMREFCLVTCLRVFHGYACWAIDSRIPLQATQLPFDAPRHRDVYPLLFAPGPVAFGAGRAAYRFDARYLQLPLRRDERAQRAMLQRALPLTVLQYRRDRLLTQRVHDQLLADAAHTADTLAGALHTSVRTLHRQLHDEGTSLQALKNAVRREIALDLLSRTARPIKQIAQATGFRDEKSFTRAFRAWTGGTPSAYRTRDDGAG